MREYTPSAAVSAKKNAVKTALFIGITGLLVAALSVVSVALFNANKDVAKAKSRLNDTYFEALSELSDEVDETVLNLSKLTLSLSRTTAVSELNDLSKHSSGAACALSRLPIDSDKTYSAMKLLNQINDFAASYFKTVARGADVGRFTSSAAKFKKAAEILQNKVGEMTRLSAEKGEIDFSGFSAGLPQIGDDEKNETPDYPEMIYDGPFSDSRKEECFKGLEDMSEIDENEAIARFEKIFSVDGAKVVGKSFNPAAYEIVGGEKFASVSVKGGMFLSISLPDELDGGKNLGEKDIYRLATDYTARFGYGDVKPVWYYESESTAFVNMAPEKDGAILYTDLVKVKISLSDGSLLGLEATGYCRNHVERNISPKITERTAAQRAGIEYDGVRLAVIPDGETEVVCYEVHGYKEGMEFYVYVDSATGECVKALKVVESGGGKLTA